MKRPVGRWLILWIGAGLLFVAMLAATLPAAAQGGAEACPALVELALQSVREVCDRLGRDEACYGHTLVEATFWDEAADLTFSAPADRVPLLDLRTLATAPLDLASETWGVALLNLQTPVEGALPGQAVTFLLMGDAQLENAVAPEDASADLAPMQAFYFTAGLSAPACTEAPDALFVQSPQGVEVALRINDLDVTIGSSIIVSLTTIPDGAGGQIPVMVVTLLQGSANVLFNDQRIAFEQPDWTDAAALPVYAVTLNAEGRVDENSVAVEPPLDAIAPAVQASCANAMIMLERPQTLCSTPLAPASIAPQTVPPSGSADPLAGVGPGDPCTAAPGSTINRRGGPGTNYPLQGQLTALESVQLAGYAEGADGYRWYQTAGGTWLRGDLVRTAGNCAALGPVPTPQPPAPAPAPSGGGRGTQVGLMWHLMACTYSEESIVSPVSFGWGVGCFDTAESANAHSNPAAFQLYVDGVALDMSVLQKRGPEVHAPVCPYGWSYYYPAIPLSPGEHTLTLNQTLIDSWQDQSGGGQAGQTNTMGCVINVTR